MNQDIKQSILWQLDDIHDVEKLCYTDKVFEMLCSRQEFWNHWYQSKGITKVKSFTTIREQIKEYKYIEKVQFKVRGLMDYLDSEEERILIFQYIADPNDYSYLQLNHEHDQALHQFLIKHEKENIQCEIIKNYIYHVPSILLGNSIEKYKVTLSQMRQFLFNVLYQDIELKKDVY